MKKRPIKDLSKDELAKILKEASVPAYRAAQILRWLYRVGVKSFDEMRDLPASLRAQLAEMFIITCPEIIDTRRSALDGTAKYLLRLSDGATVEAVFIPDSDRATVCLSSQVGCKYACSFCASAPFGFIRNLTPGEIVDEVLAIHAEHPDKPITNIVFMGIGEPFDNYDNVLKAIRLFNNPEAFGIGARRITISTCGIIPGIERLMCEGIQVELSVSLHAATDELRSKIMPVNKRYPLKDLINTCREYIAKTNRVITFEYIFIKGVNVSRADAEKLARLLGGIKCKVNTIAYNKINSAYLGERQGEIIPHDVVPDVDIREFMVVLKNAGINAFRRKSKGADIDAGCGQLRISKLSKQ